MVVICILTLSSIRITDIIKNKKTFVLYKEIFLLFFLIYILCLFQIVTFEDQSLYIRGNNLVPFREIMRYKFGSRLFIKNVVGNVVLFIPYGLFTSLYLKLNKPIHAFCLVFFASTTVEFTQLLIGRVFDIDDIILNLIGGIVGFLIYVGLDAIKNKIKIFRNDTILDILIIIILVLVMLYSFNINVFDMIGG